MKRWTAYGLAWVAIGWACVAAYALQFGLTDLLRANIDAPYIHVHRLLGESYWSHTAAGWLALSCVWLALRHVPAALATHRLSVSRRLALALIILIVAAVARLPFIGTDPPQLSDDVWRYIFDGSTLAAGDNPYAVAPESTVVQPDPSGTLAQQAAWRTNHSELVTIYQPTSQWTFAGLVASHNWWDGEAPDSVERALIAFRAGFVALDLAIVAMLLWWLHREGRSLWWATLYAWHPLAISEVAASAHQDVIGMLPLVAMLMLLSTRARRSGQWLVVGGQPEAEDDDDPPDAPLRFFLNLRHLRNLRTSSLADEHELPLRTVLRASGLFALAVGVKPIVALPLALPIAWRLRRQPVALLAGIGAAIAAGLALYMPFVLMEGGVGGMFDTVRTFADKWEFNGSVHPLLLWLGMNKAGADVTVGVMLFALLIACMASRRDLATTARVYIMAALLCSTTAYPWYLLWALMLMPVRPSLSLMVYSLTITFSYEVLAHPDDWRLSPLLGAVISVPVMLAMLWEGWQVCRERGPFADGMLEPSKV